MHILPFQGIYMKYICNCNKNSRKSIFALKYYIISLFLIFSTISIFAEEDIQIDLQSSQKNYAPGDTVALCLTVSIPEKYHLYGNPLGPGIGKPLSVITDDNNSIRWIDILKTPAKKFTPAIGNWVWAYEKKAHFFLRGIINDHSAGEIKGQFTLNGLICHTSCIPVSKKIEYIIDVGTRRDLNLAFNDNIFLASAYKDVKEKMPFEYANNSLQVNVNPGELKFNKVNVSLSTSLSNLDPVPQWGYTPHENKVKFTLWLAVLFGFIAGIILNFMPCVLPVLGIKILSFAQTNESSRSKAILRSGVFSAGILTVFLILASLASFAKFSWGEQFQNPSFLISIIVLIVIFSLWMFDVFTFNIPGSVSSLEKRNGNGLWGDYFRGVFATILATPCSGPFLGATLAWALTQPSAVIFTVFLSIGAGMAFPYVVLSYSKTLSKMIPKPGKWMKDFKNLLGFILISFAVYLLIGVPKDLVVSTIGICVVIVFAIAIYNRFAPWGISSFFRRMFSALLAILIAISGVYFCHSVLYKSMSIQTADNIADKEQWKDFSIDLLRNAHSSGRPVIIDFTANWCMNCQYNKVAVLNSNQVKALIARKNILTLKADLTTPNKEIESLMRSLGSRSVPFFAFFPGENPFDPVVMRDILSKSNVATLLKSLPDKK